jgi:hypothetical protein
MLCHMIGLARAMVCRNIGREEPTLFPAGRWPKIPVSCNPTLVSAAKTQFPLAGIIEA